MWQVSQFRKYGSQYLHQMFKKYNVVMINVPFCFSDFAKGINIGHNPGIISLLSE